MGSDRQFWALAAKALGQCSRGAGLTSQFVSGSQAYTFYSGLMFSRLTTPQIFHTAAVAVLATGAVTRSLIGDTVDCLCWIGKGRGE